MDVLIENEWKVQLHEEFEKKYFKELVEFVKQEYREGKVYPPGSRIFNAFDQCPFSQVRVVIVGQDPYHGPGQAHGLCFSVNDGVAFPPSLKNIFKELHDDLKIPVPATGNLERWARQGVLLLNATLTVRAGQAGSHQNKGWEEFTDAVLRRVSEHKSDVVFMLWGAYAQKKGAIVDSGKHLVLKCPHPSPFSAHNGFFGSGHFSKANEYLTSKKLAPVNW